MADEKESQFKQIVESLAQANSKLSTISVNTELTAEAAIEALQPVSQTDTGSEVTAPQPSEEGATKISDAILKKLDSLYELVELSWGNGSQNEFMLLMLKPIKHSLENISMYTKLMMDDIASINVLFYEMADKMLESAKSEKKSRILGLEDSQKAGKRMAEKYAKEEKQEKVSKKDKKDSGPGAVMAAAELAGDIANEIRLVTLAMGKMIFSSLKSIANGVKNATVALGTMTVIAFKKLSQFKFPEKLTKFFDKISEIGERLSSKMKAALRLAADTKFGKALLKAFDKISEIGERMVSKFKAGWRLLSESKAFKKVSSALKGLGSYVSGVVDRLMPGAKKLGKAVMAKLPGLKSVVDIGKTFAKRAMGIKDKDKEKTETVEGEKKTEPKIKPEAKQKKSGMAGAMDSVMTVAQGVGKLAKGVGRVIKDVMVNIAEGVKAFGDSKVLKGALSLTILSGALFITVKALKEMNEVDWSSLAKAGVALIGLATVAAILGKLTGQILPGAAAIAILGGALWVAAKGFEVFGGLDWSAIGKGFVALLGLAAVAAVLSFALPYIIPGAAAIAILGASLIPFAAAMALAGPAMSEFADGMAKLAEISGSDLLKIAAGIVALGYAMAAFGAGQAAAGLGNLVSKFLTLGGDSPVDQLINIGKSGAGIEQAASGLEKISKAMEGLSKLDADSMAAVNDFPWLRATAFVAAGGEMTAGDVSVRAVSKAASPDSGAQMNALEADTAAAEASAADAGSAVNVMGGSKGDVNNNVSSVTYNNNNIPDRTMWQLTPAYSY